MIKRIVTMHLRPETEALFLDIFELAKNEIRSQKGCMGIELLRSELDGKVSLWTISSWQSERDLESYRSSPLFQKTCKAVKPLFAERANAWSLTTIEYMA